MTLGDQNRHTDYFKKLQTREVLKIKTFDEKFMYQHGKEVSFSAPGKKG